MLGTIVNVGTIVAGTAAGAALGNRFSEKYREVLFTAVGMTALAVGMRATLAAADQGSSMVIIMIAMALGGVTGTAADLHGRIARASGRLAKDGRRFAEGFITAVIFFCVGTLSIVGPMESAVHGDNIMLYINACMDGITAMALGAVYGPGIMAAAPVLFFWQGLFYLVALTAREIIPEYLLSGITGAGGVLVMMSALALLGLKKVNVSDYLPALVWAPALAFGITLFDL